MSNSKRKIPEYMGRSVSMYGSRQNRGWRKKRDKWLHHCDRQDLQESIKYDRDHEKKNWKHDLWTYCSITPQEDIRMYAESRQKQPKNYLSQESHAIPETISSKEITCSGWQSTPWNWSSGMTYISIPEKFIETMNNLKKYWEKMNIDELASIFQIYNRKDTYKPELSSKEIYNEIKSIMDMKGNLSEDEFIAMCWQHVLNTGEDIMVTIKRISRRNTKTRFLGHRNQ